MKVKVLVENTVFNIAEVDTMVISHGHADHAGTLSLFF